MSIRVTVRQGLGLAKVQARRDGRAALGACLAARFDLTLPEGPQRVCVRDVAAVGLGPGVWLMGREDGGNDWARHLKSVLGGSAAVSDQSDAYVVLRLTGAGLRDTLAKLVSIDLHDRAFPPGRAAETLAAHIGVILWRLENESQEAVFELAVSRSFAASFYHALAAIAPDSDSVTSLAMGLVRRRQPQ
jgi:sarcosine oxidase subunit gamma